MPPPLNLAPPPPLSLCMPPPPNLGPPPLNLGPPPPPPGPPRPPASATATEIVAATRATAATDAIRFSFEGAMVRTAGTPLLRPSQNSNWQIGRASCRERV